MVRHKTTEQTKVLSKSDVYFVSPPEPAQLSDAQLNSLEIDTDTSTILKSFDSLSNMLVRAIAEYTFLLNYRIAGKPCHVLRYS